MGFNSGFKGLRLLNYYSHLFLEGLRKFRENFTPRCLSPTPNLKKITTAQWAQQRSRYSDWLRAGWSGDRIPVRARFSAPVQPALGVHPASCTMGTGSFPGVKSGLGVTLDPSPPSSAVVMKEQSYTSTPPMGRTACTEPQCMYKGAHYFYPYLNYSTREKKYQPLKSFVHKIVTHFIPLQGSSHLFLFIRH